MQVKTILNFGSLLISSLLLIENVTTANLHSSIFKSIALTDAECHRYLTERDGSCSMRCRGLLHRFWNQESKLSYSAIKQFYQPHPEDKCYLDRTIQCIKGVSAFQENCMRVDKYVQCYKDQYGEEDTAVARFIPFTRVQQTRILMECAAMLGISEDSLKQAAMNTSEIPHEACLLRCFLIRQGLYNDASGFNLERLEVQCGGYGSGWDPVEVRQCFDNVTDDDKCSKVQRMAKSCLPVYLKVLSNPNIRTNKFIPIVAEFMGIEASIDRFIITPQEVAVEASLGPSLDGDFLSSLASITPFSSAITGHAVSGFAVNISMRTG